MIKLSKHIAKVPLLSLLIVIGLGFAQMHYAVHAAESLYTQSEHPRDQLPHGQQDDDCLTCTLTFSALSDIELSAAPDYSPKEILTLPPYTFTNSSATKHIRLRAPPA